MFFRRGLAVAQCRLGIYGRQNQIVFLKKSK